MNSSTCAAHIVVKFDRVHADSGGGGKLVKNLSKCWGIIKKPKKSQRSEKIAKAIGLEERLSKH